MLQIQAIAFHVIIFSPAFSPILDIRLGLISVIYQLRIHVSIFGMFKYI